MNNSYQEYVEFANKLADEASKISMQYFRTKLSIDQKNDMSPVTIADQNTEIKIREMINNKYPNHGILGEEFEAIKPDSEFVWVIDPIDGTRSFIAGHKDFGNLIALTQNNNPILGIINCPAHQERWVGIINKETTMNNNVVKTSNTSLINESHFCTSGLYLEDEHFKKSCDKIINKTKYYRLGGDCYMYGMVASGLIEIVLEDTLKTHDYMALIPVIEGAGGVVTDKYGNPVTINSEGSIVASANKSLHNQIINIINN
ncbi:MAG: Histidinol-phosphatase [Alphaproteobacteria bacterium MarineAlpha5_Bin5]|nr:MAG: Histidinol-phosphatase [Alphaproteobacteria bacterium MarineAlpha5_Bin5]PPR52455.1 MAG: Histidinol-phosphatase [Alphaproteobacteria bacterium MarineAlpha5_Bin4]